MRANPYWAEFADKVITSLVRPEPGDPLLIIVDTSNDMNLAEECLAAGIRAGADTQLIIKQRHPRGMANNPRPDFVGSYPR